MPRMIEAQRWLDRQASVSNKPDRNIDMNIVAKSDLNFKGKSLVPVASITGVWLSSSDLAKALEYSNSRAVTMIYNKYADEFTSGMTQVLEVSTSSDDVEVLDSSTSKKMRNLKKKVRVFSLRGAHLIAMFARTPVAKEFRRWVLDILDKEVETKPEATPFYRYKAKLVLVDDETGEKFEILGQAKDLRTVAYGLASDLGYRPNAFTHIPVNAKKLRKIH